jgi:hypothetical protein
MILLAVRVSGWSCEFSYPAKSLRCCAVDLALRTGHLSQPVEEPPRLTGEIPERPITVLI